jgi:hypothetical protein
VSLAWATQDAARQEPEHIDSAAPWQLAESKTQREKPGAGRYRVEATFINGAERCTVAYWLPSKTGAEQRTAWLAYREIINSHKHPQSFEGRVLPSQGDR